jgi:hypothetical protein
MKRSERFEMRKEKNRMISAKRLWPLTLSLALGSPLVMAGDWIKCPGPAEERAAILSLEGEVSLRTDCPLLQDQTLLKLVNEFAVGTVFAWPQSTSCFSGPVEGTLTYDDDPTMPLYVEGTANSTHRLFPVPDGGLDQETISDDGTFAAGSAITAVNLRIDGETADILVDGHFLSTVTSESLQLADTEDLLIIGQRGERKLRGRLQGRGLLDQTSYTIAFTDMTGHVCFK